MATKPTNLFGAFDQSDNRGSGGDANANTPSTPSRGSSLTTTFAIPGTPGTPSTPPHTNTSNDGNHNRNDKSDDPRQWTEDDDEKLLDYLLIGSFDDGVDDPNDPISLSRRLDQVKTRLLEDLSRTDGGTGKREDRWWNVLVHSATSSGFACVASGTTTATAIIPASSGSKELPISYQSKDGQLHLTALCDLLGITKERAVKITQAALRSFYSVSSESMENVSNNGNGGGNSAGGNEKGKRGSGEDEQKLRSLLGTRDLFDRVLDHYRHQFLARLRIITECLRLDSEFATSDSDGNENDAGNSTLEIANTPSRRTQNSSVGKSVTQFLNGLDSQLTLNGKQRGLFQLLLRLATGPALPGMASSGYAMGELPYSVDRLHGNGRAVSGAGLGRGIMPKNVDDESLLAIRTEAAEALLVLLYGRIDGEVQRLDFFLLLEGAASCPEFEFGMSAEQFSQMGSLSGGQLQRYGRQHQPLSPLVQHSSIDVTMERLEAGALEKMKHRWNGLWALVCAECTGLWRANNTVDSHWMGKHPLFVGLDTSNPNGKQSGSGDGTPDSSSVTGESIGFALYGGDGGDANKTEAQVELESLCRKIGQLGENLRDRLRFAYEAYQRSQPNTMDVNQTQGIEEEEDDNLWGVEAPEAVALLSFGILLSLSEISSPSSEFLSMANDECFAFTYLRRLLDKIIRDPLDEVVGLDRQEVEKLVEQLAGGGSYQKLHEMRDEVKDGNELLEGLEVDAASVVYASIGREILSGTIRVFRQSLPSLQSPMAIQNIAMLADIATIIYRNSEQLCSQFWFDWEDVISGDSELTVDSLCYLLEASHNLAVSTLVNLDGGGGSDQSIAAYLLPLSTFIRFIASLCSNSLTVQKIMFGDLLLEGMISKAMLVCSALAPLVSSLMDASAPATPEECRTVRYATDVLRSMSILVRVGGAEARQWIRQSICNPGKQEATLHHGGSKMIHSIASYALPRKDCAIAQECSDLSYCALNLLADLLLDADIFWHMETLTCFSSSQDFGDSNLSGFARFASGGLHSDLTLSAVKVLSVLTLQITRNSLNLNCVPSHIESVGSGVLLGLDLLSTMYSGGEIILPISKNQADTVHKILTSTVAALVGLRPVTYLHKDEAIQDIALAYQNEIIDVLASSTSLSQIVAFFASSPILLEVVKNRNSLQELSQAMDSVGRENAAPENKRYGAWSRFVTPKRASQRAAEKSSSMLRSFSDYGTDSAVRGNGFFESSDLHAVSEMAMSLLLVWGEYIEKQSESDVDSLDHSSFLRSPCNLLLSAAPSPFSRYTKGVNISNINLVSCFASVKNALGCLSSSSILSSKIMKMCLRHTNLSYSLSGGSHFGLNSFQAALGGGSHLYPVLARSFERIGDVYFDKMEELVLLNSILLETVTIGVDNQPDLATSILLGPTRSWDLVDSILAFVQKTCDFLAPSNKRLVYDRYQILCCQLTIACLHALSGIWKSCRFHPDKEACGVVVTYLIDDKKRNSLFADLAVEISQYSLDEIVRISETTSMTDDNDGETCLHKCILLDLLTKSLDIVAVESVAQAQSSPPKLKYADILFDSKNLANWSSLLSFQKAGSIATSRWIQQFSIAATEKNIPTNLNIDLFLKSCAAEKDSSASSFFSFGLAMRFTHALDVRCNNLLVDCNSNFCLCKAESAFYVSWSCLAEVFIGRMISQHPEKAWTLANSLLNCTLNGIMMTSEALIISESLISGQRLDNAIIQPIGKLCSLLLYLLGVDHQNSPDQEQDLLGMIRRLHQSAIKIFAMTNSSVHNQKDNTLVRLKLLSSVLLLFTKLESRPRGTSNHDDIVSYNSLKVGLTELALISLESLQYAGNDDVTVSPTKYGYNYGEVTESERDMLLSDEGNSPNHQKNSFQLLQTSVALLLCLAPAGNGTVSDTQGYQSYSYGVDFAFCLKQRNAIQTLESHFRDASLVATMTYKAVHAGTSKTSLLSMHKNATYILSQITEFFNALTVSGSVVVELLLLLAEKRCYQLFLESPLWRAAFLKGEEPTSMVTHFRGYSAPLRGKSASAPNSKNLPSSEVDSLHTVWIQVITVFSSLLRSVRRQVKVYANTNDSILQHLLSVTNAAYDFVCLYEHEIFACFSSMKASQIRENVLMNSGKANSSSLSTSIISSSIAFTPALIEEASQISLLFSELCRSKQFMNSCPKQFDAVFTSCLDLLVACGNFLGSLGNARELFSALSSENLFSQPSAMFNAHPLLAAGIPNARHEAIANAHFANSCCILATSEDFARSQISCIKSTDKSNATSRDSSHVEQFQILVNNKFIVEIEEVAAQCLFNSLSVLSNAHPASNSFVSFSPEDTEFLDFASILRPGQVVAIYVQNGGFQPLRRYLPYEEGSVRYAQTISCNRSARTISVRFSDTGETEHNLSLSSLVGMEDSSKRQSILKYAPAGKSSDMRSPPSVGHLILALRWCRYSLSSEFSEISGFSHKYLVRCVAERASKLLSTEVLLNEELREEISPEVDRKVNMQLLELFHALDGKEDRSLDQVLSKDTFNAIQAQLSKNLDSAQQERDEEQKMYEQNNGWESDMSFLGGSSKREGRRSPFRAFVKRNSSGSFQ